MQRATLIVDALGERLGAPSSRDEVPASDEALTAVIRIMGDRRERRGYRRVSPEAIGSSARGIRRFLDHVAEELLTADPSLEAMLVEHPALRSTDPLVQEGASKRAVMGLEGLLGAPDFAHGLLDEGRLDDLAPGLMVGLGLTLAWKRTLARRYGRGLEGGVRTATALAHEVLHMAEKRYPDDAEVRFGRAIMLAAWGEEIGDEQRTAIRDRLEPLTAERGDGPGVHQTLGWVGLHDLALRTRDGELGTKALGRLADVMKRAGAPGEWFALESARLRIRLGEHDQARGQLDALAAESPKLEPVLAALSVDLERGRDPTPLTRVTRWDG